MKEEKNIRRKRSQSQSAEIEKKKVSKTWEAAMKLKGSLIVNDPKFLL